MFVSILYEVFVIAAMLIVWALSQYYNNAHTYCRNRDVLRFGVAVCVLRKRFYV